MNRLLSEEEADGKVAEVYAEIEEEFGKVPNFFKAQAAVDAEWLEVNWQRQKLIMLSSGGLDRKTRELIAYAVSSVNQNEYCCVAHEGMARDSGATDQEIDQTRQIIELFCSFNAIAETLRVPIDIGPVVPVDAS
ncbi:MAG: carboxymuconolactone decarboxylase family protein [Armatimonadetes bacterium]|nr:carboxymuconolactone decarboxylase family protein [Armatimonadota bacterium]